MLLAVLSDVKTMIRKETETPNIYFIQQIFTVKHPITHISVVQPTLNPYDPAGDSTLAPMFLSLAL